MFWTKKQKERMSDIGAEMTNERRYTPSDEHVAKEYEVECRLRELEAQVKQVTCQHEFTSKADPINLTLFDGLDKPLKEGCAVGYRYFRECIHCKITESTSKLDYLRFNYDKAKNELNEYFNQP